MKTERLWSIMVKDFLQSQLHYLKHFRIHTVYMALSDMVLMLSMQKRYFV